MNHKLFFIFFTCFVFVTCNAMNQDPLSRTGVKRRRLIDEYDRSTKRRKINNLEYEKLKLKESLLKQRSDTLEGIQKEFNIPRDAWEKTVQTIQLARTYHKNYCLTRHYRVDSNGTTLNDLLPNFPSVKDLCCGYNINPKCICIKFDELFDPDIIGKATDALLRISEFYQPNRSVKIEHFGPATITLPSEEWNVDTPYSYNKAAILAHELIHLINIDGTEKCFILKLLKQHGYNEHQIINNEAWNEHSRATEMIAEILPAIRNPKIAKAIKLSAKTECNANPQMKYIHLKTHPAPGAVYDLLCKITPKD